jgi:hypothetical protein
MDFTPKADSVLANENKRIYTSMVLIYFLFLISSRISEAFS